MTDQNQEFNINDVVVNVTKDGGLTFENLPLDQKLTDEEQQILTQKIRDKVAEITEQMNEENRKAHEEWEKTVEWVDIKQVIVPDNEPWIYDGVNYTRKILEWCKYHQMEFTNLTPEDREYIFETYKKMSAW